MYYQIKPFLIVCSAIHRSRTHPTPALVMLYRPRMAHPSTAKLWASASKRSRTRRCATGPRGRDDALGQRREPKAVERRIVRHSGGLFFRGFLLAEQKKATQGAGAELPAISC